MRYLITLLIVCFLMVSCSILREETKSDSISDYKITGQVAGMPLEISIKGTTKTQEAKETKIPEDGFSYLIELVLGLSGGGVIALMWRKLSAYKGLVGSIKTGIDEFKEENQDRGSVDHLLNKLSSKMDKKHKEIIKKTPKQP